MRIRELFVHSKTEIRINLLILSALILISVYRVYLPFANNFQKSTDYGIDSLLAADLLAFSERISAENFLKKEGYPERNFPDTKIKQETGFLNPIEFDPNTISEESLIEMGISAFVAGNIVRYRLSGGSFSRKEDILKIYGMEVETAEILIPFIQLSSVHENSNFHSESTKNEVNVDLNTCTSEELSRLPAIGEIRSERIVRYRQLLGGFISTNQLREVYGINDSIYKLISPYIIIDTSRIRKYDIREAEFKELLQHPYLEIPEVESLIRYRDFAGDMAGLDGIIEMEVLPPEVLKKISPYLR